MGGQLSRVTFSDDETPAVAPSEPRRVLLGLPDGPEGTRATLVIMRRLVKEALRDSGFVRFAQSVASRATVRLEIPAVLMRWVQDNIRYLSDPEDRERVTGPIEMLRVREGDCDDMTMLVSAFLKANAFPARFKAVAFEPDAFSHVYAQTRIGERWESMDCSEPVRFGWEPEGVVAAMVRDV